MMVFQDSQWESQFVTTNKRPNGPSNANNRTIRPTVGIWIRCRMDAITVSIEPFP